MIQNRYSRTQYAADWTGQVTEIKEAKKERDRLYSIMTAYERQTVSEYIGETAEKYWPTVESGMLATFNGAKANLQAALANVEREKRKVTNSWDAAKLAAEMQVYSMRIDQATKADAGRPDFAVLQAIYTEAKDSGDRVKTRAAAEALQNIVSKIPPGNMDEHGHDIRPAANRLALQASRDLEILRTSPELTAAHEKAAAKVAELNAAQAQAFDAAEVMGRPLDLIMPISPLEKALASVHPDESGNPIFDEKE